MSLKADLQSENPDAWVRGVFDFPLPPEAKVFLQINWEQGGSDMITTVQIDGFLRGQLEIAEVMPESELSEIQGSGSDIKVTASPRQCLQLKIADFRPAGEHGQYIEVRQEKKNAQA